MRQQADEQLFVSNTRAFILMPRMRPFALDGEPILLGERQGPGRLVKVHGAPLDTIRIVIFEDSVWSRGSVVRDPIPVISQQGEHISVRWDLIS